jgi:hypothetical protein
VTRKRLILVCVCVCCVLGGMAPAAWANTTSTGLSCQPDSVATGSATSCTVTVTDTASSAPSAPTGTVTFSPSPDDGSFSDSGSCTLGSPTATSASCTVDFTPTEGGGYTLSAEYGGDSTHTESLGSASVNAIDPTSIVLRCDPSTLPINASTTCTAKLTDTDTPDAPTGEVTFTSKPDTGNFAGGDECPWSPASSGAGGTATCQISFSPTAKGNYTLIASYSGDYEHAASVGTTEVTANTALTGSGTGSRNPGGLGLPTGPTKPTKPTAPTPSPSRIRISWGAAKITARHVARVRLACSGAKRESCTGFLALSTKIRMRVRVRQPVTHTHGKPPKKKRAKTVIVTESLQLGTVRYKLPTRTAKLVLVKLSKRAVVLLGKARHHRLKVTADANGVIRTITLILVKPPRHKHRHKHKHH